MLDGTEPLDATFSSTPGEFQQYVGVVRAAEEALAANAPQLSEDTTRALRRTLAFSKALRAGDELVAASVRTARNGQGLDVADLDDLLMQGAILLRDVQPGEPVTWANISLT